MILLIFVWKETYYSHYLMHNEMFIGKTISVSKMKTYVVNNIGLYYQSMSIYDLKNLLANHVPLAIAEIIISFANEMSIRHFIEDENKMLENVFKLIQGRQNGNKNVLTKDQFNQLFDTLPKEYKSQFKKMGKKK
eukprot:212919_1